MLSIQLCKEIFKKNTYTDQQMKEIDDSLYQLAELLVENYISNKKNTLLSKGKKGENERPKN
jgi:hypothetical protein